MPELLLPPVLGTFTFELFNDRVCWGATLLISCWYVWRDVVKYWILRIDSNGSRQRSNEQSGMEDKDSSRSGRILEEGEQEVRQEPQEASRIDTIYESETDVEGPSPSGRTGPDGETEIHSGHLKVPALPRRHRGST